ncbi:phosphatase PAP2 family protein [Brachybacterium huguangmaarense]|uniref:Phosphatase PAP2 family protein n=1 Tax=Brachybacterium huguangmaarense TaxID=1652028 RepID=A0ABY6G430_9MICO|nr:phosphatase PAP2 family protein [Brachybacterium huguangmaarense]UYG17973.1 phosphatase PAP2 family protein [Brachybacterium huguangmaarense]
MTRGALVLRMVLALLACAVCATGTALLAAAAVGTARGQRLDQLILTAARHDTSALTRIVFPALNTVTVPVVVVALVVAAVVALVQRRTSMALHLIVLVAGAIATTEVLKHLVVTRSALAADIDLTPNSFPSGHTTTAGAVAVAVTLASPRQVRSVVALVGAAWTAMAGIGTVAGGWHRPSDVLGALLVVGAWTFLVLAVDAAMAIVRTARDGAGRDDDRAGAEGPAAGERPARPVLPVHRGARAAIVVLGLAAVAGLALGAVLLAGVPTPLDLTDGAAQARAYRASMLLLAGASSALVGGTLALHVPAVPRRAVPRRGDPIRVR